MYRWGNHGCYKPTWIAKSSSFTAESALLLKNFPSQVFPCLFKWRMSTFSFFSLCCESNSCEKQRTPTKMRGLSELISRWGFWFFFATDGVPAAQRQRRGCSQRQKRKEKNTTKSSAEKGPRNVCVIHISRVTSKETIYLSLFHLIGSRFLKLQFDWRPFLLCLISATHGEEEKWPGKRVSCQDYCIWFYTSIWLNEFSCFFTNKCLPGCRTACAAPLR